MSKQIILDYEEYLELQKKADSVTDASQTQYVLDVLHTILKKNPQLASSDIAGALFHPKFYIDYTTSIGNQNPLKIVKK